MHRLLMVALLATMAIHVWSQDSQQPQQESNESDSDINAYQCPHTHKLGDGPSRHLYLAGEIGGSKVRMVLEQGGTGVIGAYINVNDSWSPILLGGEWKDSTIELEASRFNDRASNYDPVGAINLHVSGDEFQGSIRVIGQQPAPVQLKIDPSNWCMPSGVRWKRFENPNVPVTFLYPESWRVKLGSDGLGLTCADPEDALVEFGNGIYMRWAKEGDSQLGLLHCGHKWLSGSACDCKDPGAECSEASIEQHPGRIILNAESTDRAYCIDSGYLALADSFVTHVVLKGTWISLYPSQRMGDVVEDVARTVRLRNSSARTEPDTNAPSAIRQRQKSASSKSPASHQ